MPLKYSVYPLLRILAHVGLATLILLSIGSCASKTPSGPVKQSLLSTNLNQWQNIYAFGEATQVGDELHLISSGNWFLLSKQQFDDFIFEAEVKMPKVKEYANSGILFRAHIRDTADGSGQEAWGYQAEVDPSDRKWSGGFYEQGHRQWLHPLHKERSFPDENFLHNYSPNWDKTKANAYKAFDWNHYRIEARGADIKIWLNGVLTTHVKDVRESKGHVGIQHHGSHSYKTKGDRTNTIRFRKISLIEL